MFDELEKDIYDRLSKPMTFEQLRHRLKHIASLCWGLSIDLQNEIELRVQLQSENKGLISENKILTDRLRACKRSTGNRVGRPKKILTLEDEAERKQRYREANREAVKRYQAKKKLVQLSE